MPTGDGVSGGLSTPGERAAGRRRCKKAVAARNLLHARQGLHRRRIFCQVVSVSKPRPQPSRPEASGRATRSVRHGRPSMSDALVTYEAADGIAILTLTDPPANTY